MLCLREEKYEKQKLNKSKNMFETYVYKYFYLNIYLFTTWLLYPTRNG